VAAWKILQSEQMFAERIEARQSAILVGCSGEPAHLFPHSAASWFRIESLR
jgi:hypothetical protein